MIIVEKERESCTFADLKPGDCFRANGTVWIKVHAYLSDPFNPALNMLTGQWWYPDHEDRVQPIPNAKLVVTP